MEPPFSGVGAASERSAEAVLGDVRQVVKVLEDFQRSVGYSLGKQSLPPQRAKHERV